MITKDLVKEERWEELCNKIFSINSKIRFVGILDDNGKLLAGGMKEGVKQLEDEISQKRLFHQIAIKKEMTTMFDKIYGKVKYIFANREKVQLLTFYTYDKILLVSLEVDLDPHVTIDIAESILNLL